MEPGMSDDDFWAIIEAGRSGGGPAGAGPAGRVGDALAAAVVDRLAELPLDRILDYEERFDELHAAVLRWDVWAAAYLIGGGCSDDSFMDFRAGLIGLGREWYARVAQAPDSLAGHPLAQGSFGDLEEIFNEPLNYAAMRAYERRTGEDGSFYAAQDGRRAAAAGGPALVPDMGEDFDFDDEAEMRVRLPRLAELSFDD